MPRRGLLRSGRFLSAIRIRTSTNFSRVTWPRWLFRKAFRAKGQSLVPSTHGAAVLGSGTACAEQFDRPIFFSERIDEADQFGGGFWQRSSQDSGGIGRRSYPQLKVEVSTCTTTCRSPAGGFGISRISPEPSRWQPLKRNGFTNRIGFDNHGCHGKSPFSRSRMV
jgi:hypothetical protein